MARLVWANVNALEYCWFGNALAGPDTGSQVLLVCAGIAWMALSLRLLCRRALRRLQGAPSTGSPR